MGAGREVGGADREEVGAESGDVGILGISGNVRHFRVGLCVQVNR